MAGITEEWGPFSDVQVHQSQLKLMGNKVESDLILHPILTIIPLKNDQIIHQMVISSIFGMILTKLSEVVRIMSGDS